MQMAAVSRFFKVQYNITAMLVSKVVKLLRDVAGMFVCQCLVQTGQQVQHLHAVRRDSERSRSSRLLVPYGSSPYPRTLAGAELR